MPVSPSSPGGNVHIRNCTGQGGSGIFGGSQFVTISGNFACVNNSAFCDVELGSILGNLVVSNNSNGNGQGASGAFVRANTVDGNVQVNNNSGTRATEVFENTIGGNLQCKGNTPSVEGSHNTVTGNKRGQCAGL